MSARQRFAVELERVQDAALAMVGPATEGITVRERDDEPTPIYDAVVRELRPDRPPITA